MSDGADQIRAERGRQIVTEGYSVEHDLGHADTSLIQAARCYALDAVHKMRGITPQWPGPPPMWPWQEASWKPSDDPKRDLVKAGALIAAAIDRIDVERRAAAPLNDRGFDFGSASADEAHDEEYR